MISDDIVKNKAELNKYERLIVNIIQEMGIVKTEQLAIALEKNFNISRDDALHQLYEAQKDRRVFMSQDGYSMSKAMYFQYTADEFLDRCALSGKEHLIDFDFGSEYKVDEKYIRPFWIVVGMMPKSNDFCIGKSPWLVNYICKDKEDNSILCQITYVPKGEESVMSALIKQLPQLQNKHERDATVRIAIMEDPECEWMLPKLGFKYICKMDDTSPSKYRIVKTRTDEEKWDDFRGEK